MASISQSAEEGKSIRDAIFIQRYLDGADIVDAAIEADRIARHGPRADTVALALEINYPVSPASGISDGIFDGRTSRDQRNAR